MSLKEVFKLDLLGAVRRPSSLLLVITLPSMSLSLTEMAGAPAPYSRYTALFAYQLVFYTYPALFTQLFKGKGGLAYLLQPSGRRVMLPLISALSAVSWMVTAAVLLGYMELIMLDDYSWLGAESLSVMVSSGLFSFSLSLFIYYASESRGVYDLLLVFYQATLLALSIGLGGAPPIYLSYIHPSSLSISYLMGNTTMPGILIITLLLTLALILLLLTSRLLNRWGPEEVLDL